MTNGNKANELELEIRRYTDNKAEVLKEIEDDICSNPQLMLANPNISAEDVYEEELSMLRAKLSATETKDAGQPVEVGFSEEFLAEAREIFARRVNRGY